MVKRDIPTLASATLRVMKMKAGTPENLPTLKEIINPINTVNINISSTIRRIITWYQRAENINVIIKNPIRRNT